MQAVYYRDSAGREPVNDFIDRLPVRVQEEIDHTISLLNRLGPSDPPLPFPFSSQVCGQLRELRCHYGRQLYRVLYCRSHNLFVLLHIFEKRCLIISDNIPTMAQAKSSSPVGSTAEESSRRRAARSPAYRQQQEARADFREVAWLLIRYRMDKGLTQKELADLVGTSHSQISRIESGRHKTNFETLLRIARALDVKMLVGFESTTATGRRKRELVAI